jgi:hypothetical protein
MEQFLLLDSRTISDLLIEFFEVSFHQILFARSAYPPELFERRRKYGTIVWMSRHPEINSYIAEVLNSSKPWLSSNSIHKYILAIDTPNVNSNGNGPHQQHSSPSSSLDPDSMTLLGTTTRDVIERFVFELGAGVPRFTHNPSTSSTSSSSTESDKAETILELEATFKQFLLAITTNSSRLSPLPQSDSSDYSFAIYLHAFISNEEEHLAKWITLGNASAPHQTPLIHPHPQPQLQPLVTSSSPSSSGFVLPPSLPPGPSRVIRSFKSFRSPLLTLQLFAEEDQHAKMTL